MRKIVSIVLISLLIMTLIVGCSAKREAGIPQKQTTPTKQSAPAQDASTSIEGDIQEIDIGLSDTTSIDSGLDELDQDLATI